MNNKNKILLITSLVFIILQIIFINYYPTKIDGDSIGYVQLSESLVHNQTLSFDGQTPTALRTPGYPIFLMPFIYLGILDWVYYVQAIILLVIAFLSYKIYESLFDNKWSILVFIAILMFPPFFWYTHFIISEILFTFMLILSIYIIMNAVSKKNYYLGFLAGAVSGFACLVRPTITFFYPLIIALLIIILMFKYIVHKKNDKKFNQIIKKSFKRVILLSLVFILGFMLIYSPWIIRNFVVFDRIILSTTILPMSLHCALVNGHCANSWDGGITFIDATPEQEYLASISHTELELYDNYQSSNMKKIIDAGWGNIQTYLRDCWMLISEPDLYTPIKNAMNRVSPNVQYLIIAFLYLFLIIHWILLFGVILGLKFFWHIIRSFFSIRSFSDGFINIDLNSIFYSLFYLFIGYYILMHGFTYSIPRYFIPIVPIIIILSVSVFVTLLRFGFQMDNSEHKRKHFKKQQ